MYILDLRAANARGTSRVCPQEMFYFWTSETPFAALREKLQQKNDLINWKTIIAIFSLTDSSN